MQRMIAGVLGAVLLGGCGAARDPVVDGAWVRLPAVAGRPAAAYFTLRAGAEPLTLLSVRTPAARRAELHESMGHAGGMMTMTPIAQVPVPAGGTLAFAPGGRHVMLFDVNPALRAGGETRLTLAFADGRSIETTAALRAAGDAAP